MDHAEEACVYASNLPHLYIRGVHTHIGSQILNYQPFVEAIRKLSPLVARLRACYGIEFFSVGGGVGIVYQRALESGIEEWWEEETGRNFLTPERYAEAIMPHLASLGVKILFEPGRSLVGNAGVLVTQVIRVKKKCSRRFVIVDAGMNDLIRPALYNATHQVVPLKQQHHSFQPADDNTIVDIVGPICESGDFFLQNSAVLPDCQPGDYVAIMSAGAYGFVMSSRYNSRPLAAEIMVDDSKCFLVRERESLSDLVRGEYTIGSQKPSWQEEVKKDSTSPS